MIPLKCEACGGNDLKRFGNTYECTYCGSKYLIDSRENIVEKELTEAKLIAILQKTRALHEADRYTEELTLLIQALEQDANNASILVRLGRCYRCLNLPDKAIACYQRTLELNPYEGTAYTNMGTIHLLRENYLDAAKCYEKGLPLIDKADFDYWVANANYAVAVARLGNPQRAEEMIRESEARGYKNGQAIRKMAGIQSRSLLAKIGSFFS